jgi:hypothetical protein
MPPVADIFCHMVDVIFFDQYLQVIIELEHGHLVVIIFNILEQDLTPWCVPVTESFINIDGTVFKRICLLKITDNNDIITLWLKLPGVGANINAVAPLSMAA